MSEEVHRINHQLQKMLDSTKFDENIVNDLLINLENMRVTLEILTNTNIGRTINNLRRVSTNQEINAKAKNLLKIWKKLIPDKPSANSINKSEEDQVKTSNNTSKPTTSNESKVDGNNVKVDPNNGKIKKNIEEKKSSHAPNLVHLKASSTVDAVRIKCREMLTEALSVSEIPEGSGDPADLAGRIEDAIFNEFRDANQKYKNRVRSRISNLKDLKNPGLRNKVLLGHLTPERLATLSAEEMASDALRQERSKLNNLAISEYQLAESEGTVTDLIQCKKCRQNRCSYSELQTRSADEPMTLFVHCANCGHRWKM